MELDITEFFNSIAPMDFSASIAEIGQNAGADTWRAAMEESADTVLLQDEDEREAFREYIATFGAWDADEIAAFSDIELNALLIQLISGDMREADLCMNSSDEEWEAYEKNENIGGRLYRSADKVFYYIGE